MNSILTRREEGGAATLALRFPAGALKGAGSALTAAISEEGWLVSLGPSPVSYAPGSSPVSSWRFDAIIKEGEDAFLTGPDPLGAASGLDDAGTPEEGFSILLVLARSFSLLSAEASLPGGLVSSGILVSKEGTAALVLPPTAASRALNAGGAQARRAAVARLSWPGPIGPGGSSGPEVDASFLLAQAAYRFATGRGAFEDEAGEAGNLRARLHPPMTLSLAAPRLDPGLASLVDRALADPAQVPLRDWTAALAAAKELGWKRELTAETEAGLAKRRGALEARSRARLGRALFFRRRGAILIGAAAVAVVLALVAGDMARAQRDRPDYSWLTPRELVQRYYMAIDGLDMDSLEACGTKKAIKSDSNYLVNLVVITKTRTAYERKSPIVRAVDWLAAGKPALAPDDFLYGIAGLSLSGAETLAGRVGVSIRAEYSFWTLDRKDDPSGDPNKTSSRPFEERRIDELLLEQGKKGWQITSIDRRLAP